MGTVHNEALQQNFGGNLLEPIRFDLVEEEEKERTEPVRVRVWITQVDYNSAQKMVLAWSVKLWLDMRRAEGI